MPGSVGGLNALLIHAALTLTLNTVFNAGMDDAQLIKDLGGPTKLAELLGYDKTSGGVQRVANWVTRGIPAKVKLDHPEIFLRPVAKVGEGAAASSGPPGDQAFTQQTAEAKAA